MYDCKAVSAFPKEVCTAVAKSVAGIPPEGFEYVPVFLVNPHPETVDSVGI